MLLLDTPENNETAGDAAVRYNKSERLGPSCKPCWTTRRRVAIGLTRQATCRFFVSLGGHRREVREGILRLLLS